MIPSYFAFSRGTQQAQPSPPVSAAPTPCPVAALVCAPPTSAAAGATDDAKERRRSLAAAAIAAARAAAAASASQLYGEERVIETRRFAGKDVTVSRSVPSGGAAASTSGAAGHAAPDKKGGLDAMLASLAGPKKVNVLDKTRSDWTEFKAGDEAIDAELEAHKRSGSQVCGREWEGWGVSCVVATGTQCAGHMFLDYSSLGFPLLLDFLLYATHASPPRKKLATVGVCSTPQRTPHAFVQYLEKQAFLQEADVRQYEAERDLRMRGR